MRIEMHTFLVDYLAFTPPCGHSECFLVSQEQVHPAGPATVLVYT